MATLTYPAIYLLDWVSADPQNYDLTGKTAGVNYVEFIYFTELREMVVQEFRSNNYPGQKAYFYKLNKYGQHRIRLQVIGADKNDAARARRFLRTRMAVTSAKEYLVIKHADDDYELFYDESGAEQEVQPVLLRGIGVTRAFSELKYDIMLDMEAIWD